MRKLVTLGSLFFLFACGQQHEQSSDTSALVSQQQANRAFAIVKAIDYLPFTYIADGCYARSLYMSLELAAEGIPSSAHYVYGTLQPTSSVTWRYHVAPLLQLKDSNQEPWILDPAFEKEPLTRSQWLKKNIAKSESPLGTIAENTYTRIRAGSAYFDQSGRVAQFDSKVVKVFSAKTDSTGKVVSLDTPPIDTSILIKDFNEMPTFLSSDFHSACTVMYRYIGNESSTTREQKKEKRNKLLQNTTELISAMETQSKLEIDGVASSEEAGHQPCLDAMNSGLD